MTKQRSQRERARTERSAIPDGLAAADADPRLQGVSPDFARRVRQAIAAMPDTRPERIELARAVTLFNPPTAEQIADAILRQIGRSGG